MTRLRLTLVAVATVALAAWGAAAASAAFVTYGLAPDKMKPGCIGKESDLTCRVVTRTTSYQVQNRTIDNPMQVKKAGWLVALSLRLGNPTKSQIHYFNTTFGGTPRASLAVLRPEKGKVLARSLVAQSGYVHLQPYFGGVSTFPVTKALRVKKGDFIALNVSTWAPVLAVAQPKSYAWRASRPSDECGDKFLATPLFIANPGEDAVFGCKYTTGRITYSVTEITSPTPRYDKNQDPIKPKK